MYMPESARSPMSALVVNDHGGDADGPAAILPAINPASGFAGTAFMVAGPHIGPPGQRDIEASNARQDLDAAHVVQIVARACAHLGVDPDTVPVFHGLPRNHPGMQGLQHLITAPGVDTYMADPTTYNFLPEDPIYSQRNVAGGYEETVAWVKAQPGKTAMFIGCAAGEAVTLLNDPRLAGRFGPVLMQGDTNRNRTYFSWHSYNVDSDPLAAYELLAKFGAYFLSAVITSHPDLSSPNMAELRKQLPDAPELILRIIKETADEKTRRNRGRIVEPGQLDQNEVRPTALSDLRGFVALRELALPGKTEKLFTYTAMDVVQALRNLVEIFYPQHITPEFLSRFGHFVVSGELRGVDPDSLPPSYYVADIGDVNTSAVRHTTNRLFIPPSAGG